LSQHPTREIKGYLHHFLEDAGYLSNMSETQHRENTTCHPACEVLYPGTRILPTASWLQRPRRRYAVLVAPRR
jgi:hypothetical protein